MDSRRETFPSRCSEEANSAAGTPRTPMANYSLARKATDFYTDIVFHVGTIPFLAIAGFVVLSVLVFSTPSHPSTRAVKFDVDFETLNLGEPSFDTLDFVPNAPAGRKLNPRQVAISKGEDIDSSDRAEAEDIALGSTDGGIELSASESTTSAKLPCTPLTEDSLTVILTEAEEQYEENVRSRNAKLSAQEYQVNDIYLREFWLVPIYSCPVETRLGVWGEGGKWVCLSHYNQNPKPLVISVGSNGQISFERDVESRLHGFSHTFDFTLRNDTKKMLEGLEYLRFYDAGLSGGEDIANLKKAHPEFENSTFYTIPQMLEAINSTYADIFKIDCESCEYGVVRDMGQNYTSTTVPFGQIQMEIHDIKDEGESAHNVLKLLQTIEGLGYRMFHVEINAYYREGLEVAWIHESLVKPR